MSRVIAIASDHAGVEMKSALVEILTHMQCSVSDLGTKDGASVDYPDYAAAVSKAILDKKAELGILVCGSGIGMSMAANRFKGIRAALCRSGLDARLSRQHNNANILCLGARISGIETAKDCIKEFLSTPFEGGRHAARVAKME